MWILSTTGEEITDGTGYTGFVYLIENLTNGKKYIGQKKFTKAQRYQKKKKKKSRRVASDWQTYTGSNDQLNADIVLGHQIKKTILYLCKTKGWMNYYESKEILANDCLLSNEFYNSWVSCKINRMHLGIK